jgi:hypothetical protein
VQALPDAATLASRRAGTEVSGVTVAGRERAATGRWAALRRRVRVGVRPPDDVAPPPDPDPRPGPPAQTSPAAPPRPRLELT